MASSDDTLIATRYARALFELAGEGKLHDSVKSDLQMLAKILRESDMMKSFITNPIVTRAQAAQGVEAVLAAAGACELTRKFFALLARERRLAATTSIIEKYLDLLAESRGEMTVQVTSAAPLAKAQIDAIRSALAHASGKKVEVHAGENPALIGGVQVKIGSRMLDNTIAGKLARLRMALTKAA